MAIRSLRPDHRAGKLRSAPIRSVLRIGAVLVVALPLAALAAPHILVGLAVRGRATTSVAGVPSRSVAIVPGSRVAGGRPLPILRDRLEGALSLYEQGRVRAIVVSGQETVASPEVTVMRGWLRARGVPAADIWLDEGGTRTRETMNRAASVLGVKTAVICTQELNMPRALYLAGAAGIDAVGLALPSALGREPRWVGVEAVKTTLAVIETALGEGPPPRPVTSLTIAAE
jgi:SanA protein